MTKIAAIGAFLGLTLMGCAPLLPLTKVLDGGVSDGSILMLQGYVTLAFEGQSIHESLRDCESGDTTRALWVDISRKNIPDGWRNCSFAEVTGVYRAQMTLDTLAAGPPAPLFLSPASGHCATEA